VKIPRIFHRIWLGPRPMPEEYVCYGATWKVLHEEWDLRLWTDATLPPLINRREFELGKNAAQKADVLKYELVYRFGGIYLDTDFECLRSIEPLIADVEAFAARESDEFIAVGIFGAVPGHALLRDVVERLPRSFRDEPPGRQDLSTGPGLFTLVARNHPELVVFGPELFYPYHFTEKHRKGESFPEAYAVHHWAFSWAGDGPQGT
jgi:mannosyltransferase OCH1-like enzyme